ncbi:RDD family protein [Streptosporangium roseum]|uniref:Membrane protein/domain-like protein n=1 Tax=Streptosporangium roseum (strain ATCC 12428 / DSM 43021 / JCM 3005 / KCTC 9067 / NCIMB 10171 / NRRL 2505 / NI 9100) TaxID=479432 RepID=D2BEM9_STRRD|nr:RDD family protein [Streptosporangium roseum]ACZ84392.1 membrane protein/domain-like protein [Streptosporangium roseum DSM 43021]
MSDVVTGEAVVVEVRVAQLPSRAAALLIDIAVQLATLFGASFVVGALVFTADEALTTMIYIALTVLVLVGYPVIFETLSRGRSLGKLALGLRVVSDDGSPERFRQALFRGLAGVLEFWTLSGAPALISSLISEKGKRLGDIFAGTIVISERGPRQYGPPLEMPPQLAAWAATLELSRLPEGIATTARQYLTRWHDLSPAVQHEMGARIATEMSAFVSPPPPPGVPPFAYLTAVLAERRRRDHARLALQAGTRQPPAPAMPMPYPPQPHQQAPHPYQQTQPSHRQAQPPYQQSQPPPYPPQPHQRAPHPPRPQQPIPGPMPAPPASQPPATAPGPTSGGFVPPA